MTKILLSSLISTLIFDTASAFASGGAAAKPAGQESCYSDVQLVNDGKTINGGYSVADKTGIWTIVPLNAQVDQALAQANKNKTGVCITGAWVNPNYFAYSARKN